MVTPINTKAIKILHMNYFLLSFFFSEPEGLLDSLVLLPNILSQLDANLSWSGIGLGRDPLPAILLSC